MTTSPLYLDKQHPDVYDAMITAARQVKEAATAAGLSRILVELVNLRVSQLNACAYCLDVHARRALQDGEDPRRLAVLASWRDTDLFTPRERAALELAEAVTTLPPAQQRDEVHQRALAVLNPAEFSAVSWLAISMNAFNRLSITSRHPVRPES